MFVAVFRIAAALGVFLAGYMTLVDWRILFGIGIIAVFFIPILAKNLPDEHAKGARVDVIGFTLIGLFAGSVTMFFTDMTIFWGIAVLVTGVAFVVYINKAADPFITPEMLTNPAFAMTMIVIFVGYFFSYTLTPAATPSAERVRHRLLPGLQPAGVVDHPRRHHGLRRWPIIQKIGRKASIILALACMGGGLIAVAFLIPMGQIWLLPWRRASTTSAPRSSTSRLWIPQR
mgnify:CR=1 FL=1